MMRYAMQGIAGVAALCLLVLVAQMSKNSPRTMLGQDADWDVKSWTPGLDSLSLSRSSLSLLRARPLSFSLSLSLSLSLALSLSLSLPISLSPSLSLSLSLSLSPPLL
jgi:hypothetical protein